jgi:transcriptional regulator with XRE-family HTH domain
MRNGGEKMETKEIIKQLRQGKKLTMSEVAEKSGVSYSAYQKYELGIREIGAKALEKLADFYGVTTDYLLGRETETIPENDLASVVKNSNVQILEEILIRNYLELDNDQRQNVLDFLRRAIQEEADRQGITLSKWETVKESAMDGNGTQIKTYPVTEGEKADAAPLIDDDL